MMYKPYETTFRNQTLTIREKLANLSFTYLLLIITLAATGSLGRLTNWFVLPSVSV